MCLLDISNDELRRLRAHRLVIVMTLLAPRILKTVEHCHEFWVLEAIPTTNL